ncbi:TIGR04282 family arsenosugar biosynthesis glycosyltransferase [Nocardia salmonicida]|uniref:TIGR04282 family arsenosugar biosynthesis glycosyltransferase n=1 Tax=Nocardia salmonicida TaxID=53431 RepID=UPI0036338283
MNVRNTVDATLLVVAKAPIAGFAKTRLTPPLRPVDAATLAAASLLDTLAAVRASRPRHAVVAWTGDLSRAERADEIATALTDFEVIAQRGTTFGERLAAAHTDAAAAGLPVLQIGTDTPQAGPDLLAAAATTLLGGGTALGPAIDGGWWALGLSDPRAAQVLIDVPMSTSRTGMLTRMALHRKGYHAVLLPPLTDIDHFDDILLVAPACHGHFAATAARLCPQISAIRP